MTSRRNFNALRRAARFSLSRYLTACILGLIAECSLGAQALEEKWEPSPLDEIRAIHHDKSLSDIEIVRALTGHLDRRISMSRLVHTTPLDPSPPYEYGMIIGLIAERPYPANPKARPEAIEAVIRSLGPVENEKEVRSYLNLALGRAGGTPDEADLLRMLEDPDTDEITLAVALKAMSHSKHVPIRALPRLLELSDHPMSSISADSCVGPHDVKRKFAIRDLVIECLTRLEIKAERVLVDDGTVDQMSGKPLPETRIKIDRSSLVARLRDWLRSDDTKTWKAAAHAAKEIRGEDVDRMISDLQAEGTLTFEKLRHFRDLDR